TGRPAELVQAGSRATRLVGAAGFVVTTAAENPDVSFVVLLVAVAVTNWPTATAAGREAVKPAWPLPSVVTGASPRKVWAWGGESVALAKNSTMNVVFAWPVSEPVTVVVPAELPAALRTGAAWAWLPPATLMPPWPPGPTVIELPRTRLPEVALPAMDTA